MGVTTFSAPTVAEADLEDVLTVGMADKRTMIVNTRAGTLGVRARFSAKDLQPWPRQILAARKKLQEQQLSCAPVPHPAIGMSGGLIKLAGLRDAGVLTEEEFQVTKSRLIQAPSTPEITSQAAPRMERTVHDLAALLMNDALAALNRQEEIGAFQQVVGRGKGNLQLDEESGRRKLTEALDEGYMGILGFSTLTKDRSDCRLVVEAFDSTSSDATHVERALKAGIGGNTKTLGTSPEFLQRSH